MAHYLNNFVIDDDYEVINGKRKLLLMFIF
jgi:hypothetical protein